MLSSTPNKPPDACAPSLLNTCAPPISVHLAAGASPPSPLSVDPSISIIFLPFLFLVFCLDPFLFIS